MPAPLRYVVILLLAILFTVVAPSQSYEVNIHYVDATVGNPAGIVPFTKYPEQASAYNYLRELVPQLQTKGYLGASIDSIAVVDNRYDAWLYLGSQYSWSQLYLSGIPEGVPLAAGINVLQWKNMPISDKQLTALSERLLQWCEQNGYPFATTRLDSIIIHDDGKLSAIMLLDKGSLQKIDSIAIVGNINISRNYLLRYLDIKQGSVYNEKMLEKISVRLKELSFLQEEKDWNFQFRRDKNILQIYLKERPANQLNALIGFQPNTVQSGKFLLTADAQLAFQNILGYGENINVTYQNLQYKSPKLKADVVWPYILNTPYGLEAHFDLYKMDTTFRRTSFQFGLRYQLNATDYVRIFGTTQSNRQITIDTATIKATHTLPQDADISTFGGGGELVINHTDYRLSPRKGYIVQFSVTGVKRKIFTNNDVLSLNDGTGFNFASLYDSIKQQQYQYIFTASADYFIRLGKRATIRTAYSGGAIYGQQLFRNELYQIGGFKILRGFDEQSIFASQYQVGIAELRLLLDQNSYVYVFSDNGWVETRYSGYYHTDVYNGFGVGATLQTKTGLFSISYALGRTNESPVQFSQSRIHFGYVAYF